MLRAFLAYFWRLACTVVLAALVWAYRINHPWMPPVLGLICSGLATLVFVGGATWAIYAFWQQGKPFVKDYRQPMRQDDDDVLVLFQ